MRQSLLISAVWVTVLAVCAPNAVAAEMTARDVTSLLFNARVGDLISFQDKDLSELDLAGLDFKHANLSGANLYAADLSNAQMQGSNLSNARLDHANLANANMTRANLRRASLLTITAHASIDLRPSEAPDFSHADLRDAHIAARMDGTNFSYADLSNAKIGKLVATWGSYRPRATLLATKFFNAKLHRTNFSDAVMHFADFRQADLSGADLSGCDLTGADFRDAQLAGAIFTDADLTDVKWQGAQRMADAIGLPESIRASNRR